MSGPFELLGDPEAGACEGDACLVPTPAQAPADDPAAGSRLTGGDSPDGGEPASLRD